jgi:uncharacterized protein (DUF924 family)
VNAPLDPGPVLDFWFGAGDAAAILERNGVRWWRADPAFDAEIRGRFGTLRERAIAGALDSWRATPRGTLALILLIDQFSRNLYRGDARAFAHDALARSWTHALLARGADRELAPVERVFCYLPLEHAEDSRTQERSVALFAALCDDVPTDLRSAFENFLDFARKHRDVIERFGRFPGRNAALGRVSTPEEREFLKQPGAAF